jgi:hypothetical protein
MGAVIDEKEPWYEEQELLSLFVHWTLDIYAARVVSECKSSTNFVPRGICEL